MPKPKKLFLFVVLGTLLSACVSYPKVKNPDLDLNASNIKRLEAVYDLSNRIDRAVPLIDLLLADFSYNHGFLEKGEEMKMQLEVIDNTTLQLHIYRNGIYVSKHLIKGEIKDGYFQLKKQAFRDVSEGYFLSFPSHQKSKLALNARGNLIVHTRNRWYLDLLFIPIDSELSEYTAEIKRVIPN